MRLRCRLRNAANPDNAGQGDRTGLECLAIDNDTLSIELDAELEVSRPPGLGTG